MEKQTTVVLHHDLEKHIKAEVNKVLKEINLTPEHIYDMFYKRADEYVERCVLEVVERRFRWDDAMVANAVDRVIAFNSTGKDSRAKFQEYISQKIDEKIDEEIKRQITEKVEVRIVNG